MEQTELKTITPKGLASRPGIDAKRVRSMLRNNFSRDTKNKSWKIPLDMAKKVEKNYRQKLRDKQ